MLKLGNESVVCHKQAEAALKRPMLLAKVGNRFPLLGQFPSFTEDYFKGKLGQESLRTTEDSL